MDRKPRRGRIFSRPRRDLTPRNNFWLISKTRLPRPMTSPVASLAIRNHCSMHPHPWTSCLGYGAICRRATWHSTRQYPGVQQRNPESWSYRTQPWDNEAEPIASKGNKAFQEKIASPAGTFHKGPQPSHNKKGPEGDDGTSAEKWQSTTAHEEEKMALVAIGVAGGLAAFSLSSR